MKNINPLFLFLISFLTYSVGAMSQEEYERNLRGYYTQLQDESRLLGEKIEGYQYREMPQKYRAYERVVDVLLPKEKRLRFLGIVWGPRTRVTSSVSEDEIYHQSMLRELERCYRQDVDLTAIECVVQRQLRDRDSEKAGTENRFLKTIGLSFSAGAAIATTLVFVTFRSGLLRKE